MKGKTDVVRLVAQKRSRAHVLQEQAARSDVDHAFGRVGVMFAVTHYPKVARSIIRTARS